MAKKKKRKSLLPKRIAGVKVPKSVRKGRLGELLASRTGQALLAEAVMAAGPGEAANRLKDPAKMARAASSTSESGPAERRWPALPRGDGAGSGD